MSEHISCPTSRCAAAAFASTIQYSNPCNTASAPILVYLCHHDRSQPRCGNSEFNGRQAFASWTRAARFSDPADRLAGLCARPPWFTLSFIHLYNSSLARDQLAVEPIRSLYGWTQPSRFPQFAAVHPTSTKPLGHHLSNATTGKE